MTHVDAAADPAGPPSSGQRTGHGGPLLGVYLNDHLSGATGGAELARRMARVHGEAAAEGTGGTGRRDFADTLRWVAAEIAEDRTALLEIMGALDLPVRRYKVCMGWAAEKLGRLKSNGRLRARSPLSVVLELEALRLGVAGKAEVWQALRVLESADRRIDAQRLDHLLDRARRQADALEELRVRALPHIWDMR